MSEAETKTRGTQSAPREVLFFELEYIATAGRQAMFDAVKKVLKAKDIDVTPILFSRTGLASRPGLSVKALVEASGKKLTTTDQLAAQAEEAVKTFLTAEAELNPAMTALIQAAQKKNIQVVALSAWPKAVAVAEMSRLGLDELGVDLEPFDSDDPVFPRADHWLRILKIREQDEIPRIAILSSRAACKGALTAGATCIAVPDAFTEFEDFAGAKVVLSSLDDMKPNELLDLVSRH
jgi:hypothetical protein